jgi:hypothetical protein
VWLVSCLGTSSAPPPPLRSAVPRETRGRGYSASGRLPRTRRAGPVHEFSRWKRLPDPTNTRRPTTVSSGNPTVTTTQSLVDSHTAGRNQQIEHELPELPVTGSLEPAGRSTPIVVAHVVGTYPTVVGDIGPARRSFTRSDAILKCIAGGTLGNSLLPAGGRRQGWVCSRV